MGLLTYFIKVIWNIIEIYVIILIYIKGKFVLKCKLEMRLNFIKKRYLGGILR